MAEQPTPLKQQYKRQWRHHQTNFEHFLSENNDNFFFFRNRGRLLCSPGTSPRSPPTTPQSWSLRSAEPWRSPELWSIIEESEIEIKYLTIDGFLSFFTWRPSILGSRRMLTAWPARWSCLRRGRRSAPASTPCASSRNLKKECENRVLKNVPTCLEKFTKSLKHSFLKLEQNPKKDVCVLVYIVRSQPYLHLLHAHHHCFRERRRAEIWHQIFFSSYFEGKRRCVSSSFWKIISEPKWKKLLKLSVKKSDDDGQINYPSYLSKV